MKRPNGAGCIRKDGYVVIQVNGVNRLLHHIVAERAFGKSLPRNAVVHHVDENPTNNEPSNLVICQDQKYHLMLHMRMRALAVCGNANWLFCRYCKSYHPPEESVYRANKNGGNYLKLECERAYDRARRNRRAAA